MSMVHCRGCGRQIHESAVACPQCGATQGAVAGQGTGMPPGVKGWSWGAFLLNWIWAIGNRTWIGLLAIIPYVGFVVAIWLGFKGREMAWKNGKWDSVEHFNRVQKKWSQWGVGLVFGIAAIGIAAAIILPAYGEYQRRASGSEEQPVIAQPAAQEALEHEEEGEQEQAEAQLASAVQASAPQDLLSRAEFQSRVDGRSSQDVLSAFGQPEQTQELGGMQIWYYTGITRDPITENVDEMVQVMFRDGYVHQVSFL